MTLASRRVTPGVSPIVVVVTDNFTFTAGANLTTHTADTGQSWVIQSGTWTNTGGTTVAENGSLQSTAVIDSTRADCTVIYTFYTADGNKAAGPCWRSTDDSNYWMWDNTQGQMYKRVAGTFTAVGSAAGAGANGDVITVVLSGSSHTVKRNGTIVATASDAFNSTATKHGLRDNNTVALVEKFQVTVP